MKNILLRKFDLVCGRTTLYYLKSSLSLYDFNYPRIIQHHYSRDRATQTRTKPSPTKQNNVKISVAVYRYRKAILRNSLSGTTNRQKRLEDFENPLAYFFTLVRVTQEKCLLCTSHHQYNYLMDCKPIPSPSYHLSLHHPQNILYNFHLL